MIEDMCLRNFAETTQRSYIHYVAEFAKYFHRSPDELDLEAVRQYQLYLTQERKLSPQSVNTFVSAVQFLYRVTLEMPWDKHDFPRARLDEKLPVVLAPDEIQRFLDHVCGVKNRAVLLTCYGSGLRISEAVALQISDIDSHRKLIRVAHGKGGKDRYAMLSPCLLEVLRGYYRILRPAKPWLFPSWRPTLHLTAGAVQTACREAWQRSGLAKRVSPHVLRHASA
jgi:site-specific recombinase XerD